MKHSPIAFLFLLFSAFMSLAFAEAQVAENTVLRGSYSNS